MKALLALICLAASLQGYEPRDGDIIFQSSQSSQSRAIERATKSRYSHVGVVFHIQGKPMVLEAVQPVGYADLDEWTRRGKKGHFVVKRLKGGLSSEAAEKIRLEGEKFIGHGYDFPFAWDDTKLYCSELVWKAFERGAGIRLCKEKKLKDFNLKDPVVKAKLKERYGKQVPLEEPVVSPADLFDSKLLETLKQK